MTTKVKFTIVTLLHCTGEVNFGDKENHIFIDPVTVLPIVTILGDLNEEEQSQVKLMALHQVLTAALKKLDSMNDKILSSSPIDMNPPSGGIN